MLLCPASRAKAAGEGHPLPPAESGIQRLDLSTGNPIAPGLSLEDHAFLDIYLPQANPAKSAVLVMPGGGYEYLAYGYEGTGIAHWLNARGVAAFVLSYRLGDRHHAPIPLEDASRAMRLIRSSSARYGLDPDRIGVWGFSAGGHLASTLETHFVAGKPQAADPLERVTDRPSFSILAYPVISMKTGIAHPGSREHLMGAHPAPATVANYSNELHVTGDTPPTFLFATTDDKVVPVQNSVLFYEALVKHQVACEMHLFEHGPHGLGLAADDPRLRVWPELLQSWLAQHKWLVPIATSVPQP